MQGGTPVLPYFGNQSYSIILKSDKLYGHDKDSTNESC
jgi:hypothetical protein